MKIKCACCGYKTITDLFEICEVCFWQRDEAYGEVYVDDVGGPNHVSLSQAIANYKAFGACEQRVTQLVRQPKPDEL